MLPFSSVHRKPKTSKKMINQPINLSCPNGCEESFIRSTSQNMSFEEDLRTHIAPQLVISQSLTPPPSEPALQHMCPASGDLTLPQQQNAGNNYSSNHYELWYNELDLESAIQFVEAKNRESNIRDSHPNQNDAVNQSVRGNISSITNLCATSTQESINTKLSPSEDSFAYLHALNSDNLMKLSQQSALQEMMKEHMTIKPNINLLPTFEEHDQAGYNFHIKVNSTEPRVRGNKSNIVYSENLNKLYSRMNENVYIDAHYTLKAPVEPLRIRVFMVFSNDVSEPVVRCQNHICKDDNDNKNARHSLVRCLNPYAEYWGTETGKNIKDRYSVVIPMNACVKSQDNENQVKQQLLFSFSCNNSCIGRRETSAVFLLETMSGEILGQRLLHVKVCTCPRRDRRMDERPMNSSPQKRKVKDDSAVHGSEAKILKLDTDNSRSSYEERSDNSCPNGGVKMQIRQMDVFLESGKLVLNIKYKNAKEGLDDIRALYANAVSKELQRRYSDTNGFKSLYAKALRLT